MSFWDRLFGRKESKSTTLNLQQQERKRPAKPLGGEGEGRICSRCNRPGVVKMESGKYWCSWCNDWAVSSGVSTKTASTEGTLDALIIIFTREFSPKETFVNSILTRMNARGRPYRDWMTEGTPVRILVNPKAQDPMTFTATAMVQFRMLIGDRFDMERLEHATFEGSQGISGVILSHWKN